MHSELPGSHGCPKWGNSAIEYTVMNMNLPKRKLTRLKGYDYSTPGAYFITICTHNKSCLFCRILQAAPNEEIRIQYSPIGKIAKECLIDIESHYEKLKIDNWVIMPNHIHMLVRIEERADSAPTENRYDISNVVGKFKAAVTRNVGNAFMHSGKIWQSSFHDHIVRDERDYQMIWQYISGNPSKWLEDCFYAQEDR